MSKYLFEKNVSNVSNLKMYFPFGLNFSIGDMKKIKDIIEKKWKSFEKELFTFTFEFTQMINDCSQ